MAWCSPFLDINTPDLQHILNRAILLEHIPESWRSSITTMLYKKGDKTDLLNYRPITLLSCVYKLYSSIQSDRVNAWVEENNILNENQFGFRKGKDTADAAVRLFTCISNAQSTNKNIHIIFLYIAKAYDSVQHWALRQTLQAYGLSHSDVNILMDMIEGYNTALLMAEGVTEKIKILSGVRQGDSLSPILNSLFLNPLLEWITETTIEGYQIGTESFSVGAYADNMTLISQSVSGIEDIMSKVAIFMEHNDIKINCEKSSYHWNREHNAIIRCHGQRIQELGLEGYFTYLRWTTNLKLDWGVQVDHLIESYMTTTNNILSE